MEAMEPMVHNTNKRFRQSQDSGYPGSAPYGSNATHQSYQGPNLLTNQRSGSSDHSTGSDPGPMSRSVSESSLGLTAQDSRSTTGLPYQGGGYAASDPQPLMMQAHAPMGMQMGHAPLPNPANVLPFQENAVAASAGRGPAPPQQLNSAFVLSNHPASGMNGCIPTPAGPMSTTVSTSPLANSSLANSVMTNGHMSSGPAVSSLPAGYSPQPNNMMPNGMMPHQRMGFQQAPAMVPGSVTAVVQSAMVPTLPAVPKWEPSSAANTGSSPSSAPTTTTQLEPPCAACKSLRRKCTRDCIFLPYFPRDDPDKFARVHKVFGASNVAKMLQDLPVHQREDTVASLEYEAQARVQDPVFGCVGILCLLQKQIAMLQSQVGELQRQQGMAPRTPLQEGMPTAVASSNSNTMTQGNLQGSMMAPHT